MKVLIFNPPGINNLGFVREGRCEQRLSSFQYVMVPISLPYIGAVLKRDRVEVMIIDAVAEKFEWVQLIAKIQSEKADLIVFNISTVTYNNDIYVAEQVKKAVPNTHLTAIGVHVTATSLVTLTESIFDSVIRGEPEMTASMLTRALQNKTSLSEVPGLSFKENGQIIENRDAPLIEDLDSLPFPAREMVKNELYTFPVVNKPYTLLVPSRGCPFKCTFCTAHKYYGRNPRFRSVENVVAELKEIVQVHDIHLVTMWSDTFTFKKDFVIALSKRIIEEKLDLKWMCNSRVDTIDEEMLEWMGKSGCTGISYGIESSDQEVLNNVKKGITVEQVVKAVRATNKFGIESLAHIIFGLPGDTREKILATIRFIKKLQPSYAQFYCAVPFPGTEFYEEAIKNHWLLTADWSRFEINKAIIDRPELSARELDALRKKAYIMFYLDPRYIINRLKRIKSWKDLLVNIKQGFDFMKNWVVGKN